jgi:hypothetical protein
MKFNLRIILKDLEGKDLIHEDNKTPLTAGLTAVSALLNPEMEERGEPKKLDATEIIKRYELAKKITEHLKGEEDIELEVEEVTKIKELVAKRYLPLATGRFYDLLKEQEKNIQKTEKFEEKSE